MRVAYQMVIVSPFFDDDEQYERGAVFLLWFWWVLLLFEVRIAQFWPLSPYYLIMNALINK